MASNYLSNSFIYQHNKVPLSTKRSLSKPKSILFSNNHKHISSQTSPLCIICGGISMSSHTTSLKPKYLNYLPEISQFDILKQLQEDIKTQNLPQFNLSKEAEINTFRKKMITKIRNFKTNYKMNRESVYLSILLMDILIIKEKLTTYNKIEQFGIGCYLVSMKYYELIIVIPTIKEFERKFENENVYTCNYIRKLEVNVLKKLNYKINYISFFNVIQFFLMNGIVFNSDIITDTNYTSAYFLVHHICDIILDNGLNYFNYNQVSLACAIVALSREISEKEKWPSIFEELYHINESHFQNEFNFVKKVYSIKTQMVKINITKKKITRNTNYHVNNNLYKLKNKGFFHSNNSNTRIHSSQQPKKIINNSKTNSKSMDMTNVINSVRNISANKKINYSHVAGLRKTCSNENSRESNKEHRRFSNHMKNFFRIDSISSNRNNKIRISSAKKEIHYHHRLSSSIDKYSFNNNNIKEHFSMNSSHCTATETLNLNNMEKLYIKKTVSNNTEHKKINDYRSKIANNSKRVKKNNNNNHIPNPLNASQSFYKKINNENKSNNEIVNYQINNDNLCSNKKKDTLKKKFESFQEMTNNMLSFNSDKKTNNVKKQSFSKQKLAKRNRNNRGINEKQIRRIKKIISAQKK